MLQLAQRSRFALGIYERLAELAEPVAELARLGVEPGQLGVIGPVAALGGARRPAGVDATAWSTIALLLKEAKPQAAGPAGPELLASPWIAGLPESSSAGLLPTSRKPGGAVTPPARDLAACLANGCVALAVATASRQQYRDSIRVLLATSRFPVETHEFAADA